MSENSARIILNLIYLMIDLFYLKNEMVVFIGKDKKIFERFFIAQGCPEHWQFSDHTLNKAAIEVIKTNPEVIVITLPDYPFPEILDAQLPDWISYD